MSLKVYCDGGSRGNPGPAAAAFVIKNSEDKIIHQQGFYLGETTNNQAEYTAVIKALEYLPAKATAIFFLDSELVVKQLTGKYKIKDPNLLDKVLRIRDLARSMALIFVHVGREKYTAADKLVNQTLDQHI